MGPFMRFMKIMNTFERLHQARLGGAVGAVQQDELVDQPGAREVSHQPVDGVLHLLLAGHPPLTFTLGEVEDAEAPDAARRVRRGSRAEKVHRVAEVLRCVARL